MFTNAMKYITKKFVAQTKLTEIKQNSQSIGNLSIKWTKVPINTHLTLT